MVAAVVELDLLPLSPAALVVAVAQDHTEHREHDEGAEGVDDGVDVHVGLDHRRIEGEHQEDRDVLVEILHRDRMSRGQQRWRAVKPS